MSTSLKKILFTVSAIAILSACGETKHSGTTTPSAPASSPATPSDPAEANSAQTDALSAEFNSWLEEVFEQQLSRSPMFQTFIGRRTNYDKWDDESDAFAVESHALNMAALAEMQRRFDYDTLDSASQLSYRLAMYQGERADIMHPFRNHWYVFSQFRGPHSQIPSFMINQHRVSSLEDAEAYITRLNGIKDYLGQHRDNAADQYANGITPPQWSFAQMIATSKNIISGAPFDESGETSTLLADLDKKLQALDIDDDTRADLRARGIEALKTSVKPAYEDLITLFTAQEAATSNDDGAWKLPDGEEYYRQRLIEMTTTDMSATQIHDLGLSEVARIHEEMDAIRQSVGFEGTLQDFFVYVREDPDGKFTYPNTDQGREDYLEDATRLINTMKGRLDELFLTFPKADLEVKRVEPFREKAAGKAFYQRPSADGKRPGIYYANLYDMANMPIYQMEALAYHEGIPGHHMQLAIMQELENVPSFRKFGGFTAYTEGWGLYSEFIPKEMGFYDDPYSDFGRLAMELWRAARLVVDTGIHDKRWTRDEAINYLLENTPNPEGDCVKAIERYVVMPGQATAYKIGMLKILELRARAEAALGEGFDIRQFHDVVLRDGAVPLAILEENIDNWIAESQVQ